MQHHIAIIGHSCKTSAHHHNSCFNARIASMLMLLAMPFNTTAIRIVTMLKHIAAMFPFLHHYGNVAIARGIVTMPFGIAATPQHFPDAYY